MGEGIGEVAEWRGHGSLLLLWHLLWCAGNMVFFAHIGAYQKHKNKNDICVYSHFCVKLIQICENYTNLLDKELSWSKSQNTLAACLNLSICSNVQITKCLEASNRFQIRFKPWFLCFLPKFGKTAARPDMAYFVKFWFYSKSFQIFKYSKMNPQ